MDFKQIKRQELIVWLYSLKQLKIIRKYGYVHYISERMKYAVLYVNADQVDDVTAQLSRYHFVRSIEVSHRDDIDMTFKDAIPNRKDPDLKSKEDRESAEVGHNTDHFIQALAQSLDNNATAVE